MPLYAIVKPQGQPAQGGPPAIVRPTIVCVPVAAGGGGGGGSKLGPATGLPGNTGRLSVLWLLFLLCFFWLCCQVFVCHSPPLLSISLRF